MKVFAALLACVAMVSARNLKLDELEVGFCDGANQDVLSLDNISVEPFPLVIATGADITLNVQITLNEPVPAGATIDLKIKREGLIPIPIPCLAIEDIHIGSCSYDGDELLASAGDFLCPAYVPEGQECMLPLNPGSYGSADSLTVTLPTSPAFSLTCWHLGPTMLTPL
eukprot:TRINITY_DN3869_c0_g1_i1.p2 TRINITY_DN3869_c0_g1~~TRINITY_DN3869_c0_g1_i1.p2  ORF type:complete len:169 (-),score=59.35 TRINITY_DN3869_c0_g1_i1:137-643(-)